MRTKAHNQSKLKRIVTLPMRVLCRARDFYVRSITECATRTSSSHTMALPNGAGFSRSFSACSSTSNESEDFIELIRAASSNGVEHRYEIDMYLRQVKQASMVGSDKILPKSCSVGMGFMGRIDEERTCDIDEVGDGAKPEMYPRSRSYAVAKTSVGAI